MQTVLEQEAAQAAQSPAAVATSEEPPETDDVPARQPVAATEDAVPAQQPVAATEEDAPATLPQDLSWLSKPQVRAGQRCPKVACYRCDRENPPQHLCRGMRGQDRGVLNHPRS